jgi:hypothetical protein
MVTGHAFDGLLIHFQSGWPSPPLSAVHHRTRIGHCSVSRPSLPSEVVVGMSKCHVDNGCVDLHKIEAARIDIPDIALKY